MYVPYSCRSVRQLPACYSTLLILLVARHSQTTRYYYYYPVRGSVVMCRYMYGTCTYGTEHQHVKKTCTVIREKAVTNSLHGISIPGGRRADIVFCRSRRRRVDQIRDEAAHHCQRRLGALSKGSFYRRGRGFTDHRRCLASEHP